MAGNSPYPLRREEILSPEQFDITQAKSRLGLTSAEVGAIAGRSARSAARWLSAESVLPQQGESARAIRRLAYLDALLRDLVGEEAASEWLRTPNPGFRGEAPVDLMTSGRLEGVIDVLELLADGGPH